jgi:hypothetical protein
MKLSKLPREVIDIIYDYNSDTERRFHDVMSYIKKPPFLKRFKNDLQRIRKNYTDFKIIKENKYDVTILHQNKYYKIIATPGYPFEQPIVYCDNKRFSTFNDWSPAINIAGLIMSYYDDYCNIIVNSPYISNFPLDIHYLRKIRNN